MQVDDICLFLFPIAQAPNGKQKETTKYQGEGHDIWNDKVLMQ